MYIVVGSGPAGIMCAKALVQAGQRVTLVDVGHKLEPLILSKVNALASSPEESWDPETLASFENNYGVAKSGIPMKPIFNSYYPYAREQIRALAQVSTNCWISHGRGGFSAVWGGTMLPYTREEVAHWPVAYDDLLPHYREVARIVGVAGIVDDLDPIFPTTGELLPPPNMSEQAQNILRVLRRHRQPLAKNGIFFGRSRLALRTQAQIHAPNERPCNYLGNCHKGCVYGAIYDASSTLKELQDSPLFSYAPGLEVLKIEAHTSENPQVAVSVFDSHLRQKRVLHGERVFVGAGPIGTMKIISQSIPIDTDINLHYHPYFLLPMIQFKNHPGVVRERLHTLSQLFIEVRDRKISKFWIHLQLSTYNSIIRKELAKVLGGRGWRHRLGEKLFLGRLVAIQGYLHSRDTIPIRVKFASTAGGETKMSLSGELSQTGKNKIKKLRRKIFWNALRTGLLPLSPMTYYGKPGDGNHIGGSFPMSKNPEKFQTSSSGELKAMPGVHLIDASILPDLPSATITFTVMANAHRIGTMMSAKNGRRDEGK